MNTLDLIRRWLLAVLSLGVVGTAVELVLLGHYETAVQFVPLVSIALALTVILWHSIKGGARSIRALQATMVVFVIAGGAGVAFHFQGGAEFQKEIDPTQSRWVVFTKVMRAKAPPVLAPGLMVQLGLVGLAYAYRHPALESDGVRK
jgi:multisubunit Na+/H+ antiporter MnhB subunit